MYTAEVVKEVFPFIFTTPTQAGVSRREPGMPSSAGDPRRATMMNDAVADVRWAWRTCEWISDRQAKAVLLTVLPYRDADLAEILGVSGSNYSHLMNVGFRELANWLNATPEQREARYVPA